VSGAYNDNHANADNLDTAIDAKAQLLLHDLVGPDWKHQVTCTSFSMFIASHVSNVLGFTRRRFRKGIDAKAQLLADIKAVIRQSDASSSDGASAFELSLKSHRANQVRGLLGVTVSNVAQSDLYKLSCNTPRKNAMARRCSIKRSSPVQCAEVVALVT
jgi:hypothetical protein